MHLGFAVTNKTEVFFYETTITNNKNVVKLKKRDQESKQQVNAF